MRVFLAAPMTGWWDPAAGPAAGALRDFLTCLKSELAQAGHQVFSAHCVEEFGCKPRHASLCTPFDFLELRRADVVVAFPSVSGGVHTELGWASAFSKPVILLTSGAESPLARGLHTLTSTASIPVSAYFPNNQEERNRVVHEIMSRMGSFPQSVPRKHIAFVATAFGFGPVAKAVAIAQEFRRRNHDAHLDFFGCGIDHDFAVSSGMFDQVVRFDIDDNAAIPDLAEHLRMYDDVISVMNFSLARAWKPDGARLHVVDSLAWMWQEPPDGLQNACHYFVQHYLLDADRLSRWSAHLPIRPVGHICRDLSTGTREESGKGRRLVINLSGCANPFVEESIYCEYATTLLQWIAAEVSGRYDRITVCVQSRLARIIRDRVCFPCAAECVHLSPDAFTAAMASADRILTTPGITTTLEAMALGKRPCFLLAQNYSQALLNERNLVLYPEQLSMAFSCLGDEFEVPENLPEEEGVRLVAQLIIRALREKQVWLRERIHTMLCADIPDISGGPQPTGQEEIVDVITRYSMHSANRESVGN